MAAVRYNLTRFVAYWNALKIWFLSRLEKMVQEVCLFVPNPTVELLRVRVCFHCWIEGNTGKHFIGFYLLKQEKVHLPKNATRYDLGGRANQNTTDRHKICAYA